MPSREEFAAYRKVQDSGKYNMILNAQEAAAEAGLSMKTYKLCVLNYTNLLLKYACSFQESSSLI